MPYYHQFKLGCDTNLKLEIRETEPATDVLPDSYSRVVDAPLILGHNDQIGDCVIVGILNYIRETFYRAGRKDSITEDLGPQLYSAITGYVPGNPLTDNGTNPEDALAYWKQNPIAGAELIDFARIDHTNSEAIKNSIVKTGGVLLICELSVEQQRQTEWVPEGQPGTWGGHCVCIVQYTGADYTAITWGMLMQVLNLYMSSDFVVGAYELAITLGN